MTSNQHDRLGNHGIYEDMREFVRKIKSKASCGQTPNLDTKFAEILADFRTSKINLDEVNDKVADLFGDHDDLLQGFHMIMKDHEDTPIRLGNHGIYEDVTEYVRKIKSKASCGQTPNLDTKFAEILVDFWSSKINFDEMTDKVADLFGDHDDLLEGFHMIMKDHEHTPFRSNAAEYLEKDRFKAFNIQTPQLYTQLCDIFTDYGTSKISIHEVKYKIVNLFHNDDELLQDFYTI